VTTETFSLDAVPPGAGTIISGYNFREVAPTRLSPLSWSVVGAGMEIGFRDMARALGMPVADPAPQFVAYVGFSPFHVLSSIQSLLHAVPGIRGDDLWDLLLGGRPDDLPQDAPPRTTLRQAIGTVRQLKLVSTFSRRVATAACAVDEVEHAALEVLAAPSDVRIARLWPDAVRVARQAWAAHVATTSQMVIAAAALRRVIEREASGEEYRMILTLAGFRGSDASTVPTPGRLDDERDRFVTYEVVDRALAFAPPPDVEEPAPPSASPGPVRGIGPPRLGGAGERLIGALSYALGERERTKAVGLRALHTLRLLVDQLKSPALDVVAFVGSDELFSRSDNELERLAERRADELARAIREPVAIDYVRTARLQLRSLQRPVATLTKPMGGRSLAPGWAQGELVRDPFASNRPVLFGRTIEAQLIMRGMPVAVVSELGSPLSHIAILCRELNIPCVAGIHVDPGHEHTAVVVDGWTGMVTPSA
jgi:hypothetical protein